MPTNTTRSFVSTRRFGVEIEFCTRLSMTTIEEKLSAAGLEVRAEDYNHRTRPHWKIVTDSSVSRGFELVSPPLSGEDGIEEVKRAVAALVEAGCTVDTSCGLHVHVDAGNLSGASVVNVLRRYSAHESAIDAMVPSHRRNNTYARSVRNDFQTVETYLRSNPNANAREVCEQVYDRYRKLNATAFVKHGTLEFRQHSGSIDGTKIANWIMFCVQFVDDSVVTVRTVLPTPAPVQTPVAVPVAPAVAAPQAPTNERINARSRQYRKLLELFLSVGCYRNVSAATIAETLEIAESSVPSYISMFRDAYPAVVVKARRNRGYYTTVSNATLETALSPNGVRTVHAPVAPAVVRPVAPVAPVVPVTVVEVPVDRGLFANLPISVAAYYQERTMDFQY